MGWQWVDDGTPQTAQPDGQATQSMMNARAAGQQVNTVAGANAWGQQQQAQMGQPQAAPAMGNQNAAMMNERAQAATQASGTIGGPQPVARAAAQPAPFANYANALGGQRRGYGGGMQMQGAQLGQSPAPGQAQNMQAMERSQAQSFAAKTPGQTDTIGGAPAPGAQANQQAMDEQRRKDFAVGGVG